MGIVVAIIGGVMAVVGLFTVCTNSDIYSSLTGTPTCAETLAVSILGFALVVVGIVLAAVGAQQPVAAVAVPTGYSVPPPPGSAPGVWQPSPNPPERFCPVCGKGNANASSFCDRCGRRLPPPPTR